MDSILLMSPKKEHTRLLARFEPTFTQTGLVLVLLKEITPISLPTVRQ